MISPEGVFIDLNAGLLSKKIDPFQGIAISKCVFADELNLSGNGNIGERLAFVECPLPNGSQAGGEGDAP